MEARKRKTYETNYVRYHKIFILQGIKESGSYLA